MAVIERRGAHQWRALVRRRGYPSYSRTFQRQRDAQRWATELEAAIGMRDFPTVRRLTSDHEALGGCLGSLIDRFEHEVSPGRKQHRTERARLRRLRAWFGRLPVTMLAPQDVVGYRNARLAEGASTGTVRHDLNTLSVVLGHAVSEWGVEGLRNVVRDVKKPPMPPGRERRLSSQEFQWLLLAARPSPDEPPTQAPARGLAPLIVLAVESSMRLGEMLGMRWRDVNWTQRTVFLPSTKNGECRSVALSSAAIAALRELHAAPRPDGKVFDWARSDSVSHPFRRCVQRAQVRYRQGCAVRGEKPEDGFLENLRFHDLRHEAISRLFERDLNPFEVATMSGHKSMQMLRRYTHLHARKVAAKLG